MANDVASLMSDGLASPLGDVIAAVGRGVAEAQAALDAASLSQTLALYDTEGDAALTLLRDIGYRPTFYVLPETSCEVHVSMRIGGSGGPDGSAGTALVPGAVSKARTYITPVDAGFATRFGFQAQAAAKLTFKIVPVPPPSALDDTRPVPNLVDRKAEDAVATLETLGFEAVTLDARGESIAVTARPGLLVASQDLVARSLQPIGSRVTLVLRQP